jgi:hypothetical protein
VIKNTNEVIDNTQAKHKLETLREKEGTGVHLYKRVAIM